MKTNTKIETYLGNQIDLLNPKPSQVDIKDIARGLAMTVRFGGHLEEFYSVAQHSIATANLLESLGDSREVQMYGLLHDAPEAYLGDVVRPLKRMLPSYKKLEKKMMKAVLKGLGLKLNLTEEQLMHVTAADDSMVVWERFSLKSHCCKRYGWAVYQRHAKTTLQDPSDWNKLSGMPWRRAEQKFLEHYKYLKGKL